MRSLVLSSLSRLSRSVPLQYLSDGGGRRAAWGTVDAGERCCWLGSGRGDGRTRGVGPAARPPAVRRPAQRLGLAPASPAAWGQGTAEQRAI